MKLRLIAYWPSLDRRTVEVIRQVCATDNARNVAPNFSTWLHGQAVLEIHRRESVESEDGIPHDVNGVMIDTRLFSPLDLAQAIEVVTALIVRVGADPGRLFLCKLMYAISVALMDCVGGGRSEREPEIRGIGQDMHR